MLQITIWESGFKCIMSRHSSTALCFDLRVILSYFISYTDYRPSVGSFPFRIGISDVSCWSLSSLIDKTSSRQICQCSGSEGINFNTQRGFWIRCEVGLMIGGKIRHLCHETISWGGVIALWWVTTKYPKAVRNRFSIVMMGAWTTICEKSSLVISVDISTTFLGDQKCKNRNRRSKYSKCL